MLIHVSLPPLITDSLSPAHLGSILTGNKSSESFSPLTILFCFLAGKEKANWKVYQTAILATWRKLKGCRTQLSLHSQQPNLWTPAISGRRNGAVYSVDMLSNIDVKCPSLFTAVFIFIAFMVLIHVWGPTVLKPRAVLILPLSEYQIITRKVVTKRRLWGSTFHTSWITLFASPQFLYVYVYIKNWKNDKVSVLNKLHPHFCHW